MTKNNTQESKLTKEQEEIIRGELSKLATIAVDEYFKRKVAERASKLLKKH